MIKRILGILFLFSGLFLLSFVKYQDTMIEQTNETQIEEYFEEETSPTPTSTVLNVGQESYLGVLEIPKINLKRGFLSLGDKNNNVNKNIEVLKNSTMPDEDKSLLAIAGHSGNGKRSYFKYLYKLNTNDLIYVYYKGIKYTYEIVSKYDVLKDGDIEVIRSNNKMLVLTTCSQTDRTKQIVIVSNLINQEIF